VAGLRTQLNELGNIKGLLPTTKNHLLGDLNEEIDASIKAASGERPEAAAMRSQIEKDYAVEIKKFKDNLAQRLVKEAGSRGSIDADDVIPLMTRSLGQF